MTDGLKVIDHKMIYFEIVYCIIIFYFHIVDARIRGLIVISKDFRDNILGKRF